MATYEQSPGRFNMAFRRGDTLSAELDFSVDITGYSLTANSVSAVTGLSVKSLAAQVTSAADGKVVVSLTPQETLAIPTGTYAWNMSWIEPTGLARTVLSGFIEVS